MGKNIALPSTLIVSFDGPSASAFNLGGHKGTHPSPSRAHTFPSLSAFVSLSLSRASTWKRVYAYAPVKHAFVRDPRRATRTRSLREENRKKRWKKERQIKKKKKREKEGRKKSGARATTSARRELSGRSSSVTDEYIHVRRKGYTGIPRRFADRTGVDPEEGVEIKRERERESEAEKPFFKRELASAPRTSVFYTVEGMFSSFSRALPRPTLSFNSTTLLLASASLFPTDSKCLSSPLYIPLFLSIAL